MKRIIIFTLTLVMALSLGVQVYAAPADAIGRTDSKNAAAEKIDPVDYREKESAAYNIYMAMLTEWSEDKDNVSDLTADYPDYYGGSYINENHDFVIQVVGPVDDAIADLSRFIDTDGVIFEEVKYTYNQLQEEADRIAAEMQTSGTKAAEAVSLVGIAGKENSMLIYIKNAKGKSSDNSDLLEGITDFENVIVVNTDEKEQEYDSDSIVSDTAVSFTLYPGDRGTTENSYFSAGFWCTDILGRLGVVTASYNGAYTNNAVSFGGTYFGTCTNSQIGGGVDAAFVLRENTSIYPTNFVPGHNILLSNVMASTVPIGMTVYTRGCMSGAQTGVVEAVNVYTSYGMGGLFLTSNNCLYGDKGGIAAIYTNNQYCIAGIIGEATADNKAEIVRSDLIRDALYVTPY